VKQPFNLIVPSRQRGSVWGHGIKASPHSPHPQVFESGEKRDHPGAHLGQESGSFPLVRPLSTDDQAGLLFLESLQKIKKSLPEVKTIAGLSNISFGLPKRKLMNRAFLVLALKYGLDAAILDPLDKKLLASLSAAQALLGKDPSLKNYLSHFRPCKQ